MADDPERPPPQVLTRAVGALGRATLNRPRAINALDLGMIESLHDALRAWAADTDVETVLLDGAGDRGFCAGGDVRGLYEQIVAGHVDGPGIFFRAEYALNAAIAESAKPIVAFADGVTMGGGIGLAGHAAIRIVTERSQLAMPETRIGFTPDVGGTWLLARAPGRLGEYLGLTGSTMDAADAVYAGFADHFVPSSRLNALREALETRADPTSPTELVLLFDETPDPSSLARARPWIDDAFAADTVGGIVERLRRRREKRAREAADLLEQLSPTGLAVTLAAVRAARGLPDLRTALAQEYGLVMWFAATQPDLVEGIRAQLVDKTRDPRWQPATLADLDPDAAADAFAYVPATPLWADMTNDVDPPKPRRWWSVGVAVDWFFFVFAGLAAVWLAYLGFTETFRVGWFGLPFAIAFWVLLAYLVLPRLHRILTTIYVPDYFIGRARTSDGLLGDPVNIAFVGDGERIRQAMSTADWTEADPVTLASSWRIITSTVRRRSYHRAPVSPLFLFGRQQDFAFQQEVDGNPAQRHHVRFWKCPDGWLLPGGVQADWLAAGTFDTAVGLSLFTLQVTHKIDADTDVERDHIVSSMTAADPRVVVRVVKDFSTGYHSRNGGGDSIRTDGDLPIVDVRAVAMAASAVEATADEGVAS